MSDKNISQKEAEEYIENVDNELNPISDIGHSYSYQNDDFKLNATVLAISEEFKKIIDKYQDVISSDSNIQDNVENLHQSLNNLDQEKNVHQENFQSLINSLAQVVREDQRITNESPSISQNDTEYEADKLNELKLEVENLKISLLENV